MVCKASSFTGLNEQDKTWSNWSGDVQFTASEYWEPTHSAANVDDGLEQLVYVIAKATEDDRSVHAIGSGWAFEDAAASDDWVVSLRNLDRQLQYVVGNGGAALTDTWRARQANATSTRVLVHVESGIRIATLSELLESQGLSMPTLGGSNGQALAGVISTSTHGGDWQQPPFPDLVRAIHLVTDGGKELWIERASDPITSDERLTPVLPCDDTEILRDDRAFDAAIVACGRFGVIYSFVLEVRRTLRVVEAVTTPTRAEVMQALRDGVAAGTVFEPLFDLLETTSVPSGLDDASGTPYFLQVLFSSQNPNDVWVHRRWETTNAQDLPVPPPPPPPGSVRVTAEGSDHDLAVAMVEAVNAALLAATLAAQLIPIAGQIAALYITGVAVYFNAVVASREFTLGSVVAAALDALWKVPAVSHLVPGLNYQVIDGRFRPVIESGRRGPHHLITSGTRSDSDSISYRAASIELVFDATTTNYLDFLDEILPVAPSFQQAGYISLRPSRASKAYLSMHGVSGSHAMSIEISSLQGLPGNDEWMAYVHRRAVARGGRPHWGQYNKLDALDVSMLYGRSLNEWREGLLRVSGTSTRFSNEFSRYRGLEPVSIAREVTAVRKKRGGVITHLCNGEASWSPVTVRQAVREIESGTIQYFVRSGNRLVPVQAVGGDYVRSQADDSEVNNLDNLPGC
jgi:Protein of unknown function (DUF3892)/FAD binding domain